MAPSSSRGGAPFLWVCIHTAEGARTAEALGNFFNSGVSASSHVGIDAGGILQYVPYDRAAWTLRNGNEESDNAEICGFAGWTRAEWLSTGTVDGCANPRMMVRRAALWAKARCAARGISTQHLTPAQVGARQMRGVIDHDDYSKGTGDGTHWDVGNNFPWDVFYADMENGNMAITDADADKIALAVMGYKNANVSPKDAFQMLVDASRVPAYKNTNVDDRDLYGLVVSAVNDSERAKAIATQNQVEIRALDDKVEQLLAIAQTPPPPPPQQ
jgi:hypothetical protein